MPLFHYKTINADGRKSEGVLNAADTGSAAAFLRESNLFILGLSERGRANVSPAGHQGIRHGSGLKYFWRRFLPVTKREIIFFFRQLAMMRRTGLTLLNSLQVCRDQSSKPRLRRIIDKLMESVQSGLSLSAALAQTKGYFPEIAVKMIVTAEATGELADILDQIVIQMERSQELKNTILTGLMYPVLVVFIMLGVVTYLVTTVIPKFASFLKQRNAALPASTQLLMDISNFLNANKIIIITGFGIIFAAIALGYLIPRVRLIIDRLLLSIPIVGGILTTAFMAHLGRTLSVLLRSGVTLLDSIHVLSEGIPNRAIARHLAYVENEVLKGQSFSDGLRANIIPSLIVEIVNVGEVTGSLDQVLDEIGSFYEQNLQRRIKWMIALFEPAVILLVGGAVGFVYFAFFQALFQLARI